MQMISQFRVVRRARADLRATGAVQLGRAMALRAVASRPAFRASARAVRDVARGPVQALNHTEAC